MPTQPEQKLHKDLAKAAKGDRIAFDFHRQAWFPVNGSIPQGAVTATLSADAVYDRQHGMRSRAIAFNLEHGDGDAQEEVSADA